MLISPAIELTNKNLSAFLENLVPEAVGIFFTVAIIERFATNRNRENLKTRLLNESKSSANGIAVNALNWLRREGWINQNTFQGNSLTNMNWQGAYVAELDLSYAILHRTNFSHTRTTYIIEDVSINKPIIMHHADLWQTDLRNCTLRGADLRHTKLIETNLQKAYLWQANLQDADLQGADLRYTNLNEANLTGVNLQDVIFNEFTVLPDAQYIDETNTFTNYWTPETDMRRYTDTNHPNFWQPAWVNKDS